MYFWTSGPDDYIPLRSTSLEFSNTSMYQHLDIYIVDDGVLDGSLAEYFYLVLISSDPAFGGGEVTVDTAHVAIIDTSGTGSTWIANGLAIPLNFSMPL